MGVLASAGKAISSGFANDPFGTISGGLGVLSGIGSLFGLGSGVSQEDMMEWQEKMIQQQQQFQAGEAQKSRDWQSQMWQKNADWNSIGAQFRRASAAGVNPFMLAGNSSYGSTSSGTPSGAMASGVSPVPYAPNTEKQSFDSFNAIAAGLQSLANARQAGIDTSFAAQSFTDRLSKIASEADFQELTNEYQRVINQFVGEKQANDISIQLSTIKNLDASTENYKQLVEESKKKVYEIIARTDLTNEQKRQLKKYTDNYFDAAMQANIELTRQKANTEKTEQQANIAAANKYNAEAVTQNALRAYYYGQADAATTHAELNRTLNQLRGLELDVAKETNAAQKDALINEYAARAEQAGLISDMQRVRLEMLKTEEKWQVFQMIVKDVNEAGRTVSSFIPGTSPSDYHESKAVYKSDGSETVIDINRKYSK